MDKDDAEIAMAAMKWIKMNDVKPKDDPDDEIESLAGLSDDFFDIIDTELER